MLQEIYKILLFLHLTKYFHKLPEIPWYHLKYQKSNTFKDFLSNYNRFLLLTKTKTNFFTTCNDE